MLTEILKRLDPGGRARRPFKTVRNLFSDPLPRSAELVYDSWEYEHPAVKYRYRVGSRSYVSTILLDDLDAAEVQSVDLSLLERLLASIGLAITPIYFRLTDFAAVRVECIGLDADAIAFFETYLERGLAEFRYRHGLNPLRPVRVYSTRPAPCATPCAVSGDGLLMLNGGGKDTVVMAELLSGTNQRLGWCCVNPDAIHERLSAAHGTAQNVRLRYIRGEEFMSAARYPWGHVPWSGVYMWLGVLVAVVRGYRYLTTGNEYSSNFGNVTFKGTDINHQFTKSHSYECEFSSLIERRFATGVRCFSALRPFHDLRLAAIASSLPRYFGAFNSCNLPPGGWCGRCAKCAWTYLAMGAFLDDRSLIEIFGSNFIDNPAIRRHVIQLARGTIKPWECVGTQDESRLALAMFLERHPSMGFEDRPHLKDLQAACKGVIIAEMQGTYLQATCGPHAIPEQLWTLMDRRARELTSHSGVSVA